MMSHKQDDLEQYETHQAQDLIHLFEAAQSPHEIQAPADFRAKVLTQLEQRHAHRGWLFPLTLTLSPAWGLALAACLLLSLSVNAWLGLQTLGSGIPEPHQAKAPGVTHDALFDTYAFQATITSEIDLATLATAHSVIGEQAVMFGFAGQSGGAQSFIIGTLYAESLAYLRSGDVNGAQQRLAAMMKALDTAPLDRSLATYLNTIQPLLSSQQETLEVLGTFLSLFEPLYTAYLEHQAPDEVTLFQAGTWLENMTIAAAAKDYKALKQERIVTYFMRTMRQLNAPKGILEALEQMGHIMAKPEIATKDIATLHRLVKKIQRLLG